MPLLIALPDTSSETDLIEVALQLSRLANSKDKKFSRLGDGLLMALFDLYLVRYKYITKLKHSSQAVPGEEFCNKSIYLLYLAIEGNERIRKKLLSVELNSEYKKLFSKFGFSWSISCLLSLRKVNSNFSDSVFEFLFKRVATQILCFFVIILLVAFAFMANQVTVSQLQ